MKQCYCCPNCKGLIIVAERHGVDELSRPFNVKNDVGMQEEADVMAAVQDLKPLEPAKTGGRVLNITYRQTPNLEKQ